jgi:hypothetical protein
MVLEKIESEKSEFVLIFNQKIIGKICRIVKMPVDEAKQHFQPDNGFQDFIDLGDNLSIAIQKQFG